METYIWRRYQGHKIVGEGTIQAPCRVTAKTIVTKASHTGSWRKGWREHEYGVIKSYRDFRIYNFGHQASSIVFFFEPENERAFMDSITPDNQKNEQETLF